MFARSTWLAAVALGIAVGSLTGCSQPDTVRVTFHPIGDDVRIPVGGAGDLVAPMQFATESGVRCLRTLKPDKTSGATSQAAETGGRATFSVDVPQAGVYTLYGRVFWPPDGGGFNSFWVRMDGQPYQSFGNHGPEGRWIYFKGPAWDLAAGQHTLTVRERESGACAADWFLSPVPEYILRTATFENGQVTCSQPDLRADRPFELRADVGRCRVFRIRGGTSDIRAAGEPMPLAIRSPDGRTLYAGTLPPGQEVEIVLPRPSEGDHVVEVAGRQAHWQWLKPRLARLESRMSRLRTRKNTSDSFRYWWPTLVLRHQNILRGCPCGEDLRDKPAPSLPYMLREFDRAEQIAGALAREDYAGLDAPGMDERAFYSDVDGLLCPYVICLPRGYFQTQARLPMVLLLHGGNGTQWSLATSLDDRGSTLEDIRWPSVSPLARGSSNYAGPAEKDLLQMMRQLLSRHRFDEKRLVVAGFSMGGGGTWRLVGDYPEMFETAIPIGGGRPQDWYGSREKPQELPRNLRTRIIIAHSPEDTMVPLALAEKAKQYLTERGIPFKFITYPGGHTVYPGLVDLLNGLYP